MPDRRARCPLTRQQLIDEYFIENRTRLLDLAAFLDRLDWASDQRAEDFRIVAFEAALKVLSSRTPDGVRQVQMIFSDPTTEPTEILDRKSAYGAYDPGRQEVR